MMLFVTIPSRLFELLPIFTFFVALLAIYEGVRVAVALWRKAAINEVGLFFGPALFTSRFPLFTFRLNAIPLGAYVSFHSEDPPPDTRSFLSLSFAERLCLHLAPCWRWWWWEWHC